MYVWRWGSASEVPPESGLAVVLGDDIDILSSGIFTNGNGRNGQNPLISQSLDRANPLLYTVIPSPVARQIQQ